METVDVANDIRRYIIEELLTDDGTALRIDSPLWGGVIDSVGLMQLITYIEEQFGIEIADDELTSAQFGTVSDIAELVSRRAASG